VQRQHGAAALRVLIGTWIPARWLRRGYRGLPGHAGPARAPPAMSGRHSANPTSPAQP